MRRVGRLVLLLALLLATPALAAPKSADYAGADGGYLVYGVGTIQFGMHFGFPYRPVSLPEGVAAKPWKGEIQPTVGGAIYLKIKNPDFEGRESGHVVVRRLPPGEYVIDDFSFGGQLAGMSYAWSSATPFAIRFTIRPGEAIYIGSYMRAISAGTPLEPQLGAAGFFVIADRSERDLPIARTRLPPAIAITPQVTDVDAFGSPALRSREP